MEKTNKVLLHFLNGSKHDPYLGSVHVALYIAILCKWINCGCKERIYLGSKELMEDAKIQSPITYYRALKQLHQSGCIIYRPSYNKMKPSEIHLTGPTD